ncbi:hypothetical protein [Streptomyces lydicus]|uniref:hypothetical protein n=1 Tax=Streptomyces lydicus TaxID=47763 RepID=UPI003787C403
MLVSVFSEKLVAAWRPGGLAAWRPGDLAAWRARAAKEYPSDLRAAAGPVRYTLLSTLCHVRETEITDSLVELFIQLVQKINTRAAKKVEGEFNKQLKRVRGKEGLLLRLADAAVAEPGGTVRKVTPTSNWPPRRRPGCPAPAPPPECPLPSRRAAGQARSERPPGSPRSGTTTSTRYSYTRPPAPGLRQRRDPTASHS